MNYEEANAYLDKLSKDFPNGSSLIFLFMWDYIRDTFTDIERAVEGDSTWGDYKVAEGVTLETVWNKFNEKLWGDFTIEGGDIVDWLQNKNLIVDWEEEEEETTNA
jgi:hypothetical protein